MIEFINAVSLNFVLLILVILGGLVTLVGIIAARNTSKRKDEMKHQEFEDTVESTHRERMATIAATRDQEIAKHTGKKANENKMIEG